jgi:SAM-dependent methyltransferase
MFRTIEDVLEAWKRAPLSPPMALMEMLLVTRDADRVEAALRARIASGDDCEQLLRLLEENRAGCADVVRIAADDRPLRDVSDVRAMFDRAVATSEEASVALYSLGDAALLESATREILEQLSAWRLLEDRRVLDFGCGTARVAVALSPFVAEVVGVDLSPKMIDVARRRTIDLANASFEVVSGDSLPFEPARFDLAVAVDSMPYVVGLGSELVEANVAELVRVLRPGGDFLMFGFSYRDDLEADRRDVAALAERHGFDVLLNGAARFSRWNARTYWLRSRAQTPREPREKSSAANVSTAS